MYAKEGAESTIVYLPVEEKGGKMHLITVDLRSHQVCRNVIEKALEAIGAMDILVLNHGFQMMQETIGDLSE
jgi:NADP-dependent 3-hydroxy acid dehydrogenase YdfG